MQLRDRSNPDVLCPIGVQPVAVCQGSDSYDVERTSWFEEAIGIMEEVTGIFLEPPVLVGCLPVAFDCRTIQ